MKSSIFVVGSSNTDMVIRAEHLPAAGETILGGTFFMNPGGKGANQAVAAARLGGSVLFVCKTGNDIFGRQSVQLFKDESIDTSYLLSDSANPSGVALITVDKEGENCIVVASGSNATLTPGDLEEAMPAITKAAVLLLQLEIPLATVEYAAQSAAEAGVKVILNPAPAQKLPSSLFRNISIITPNKNEAEVLSGIKADNMEDAKKAAAAIHEKGVETVIITLGSAGALVYHEKTFTHVTALKVKAVDTTAAGDVFNGALAVALSEQKDIIAATEFACRAAAISVTRLGAQSSAPQRSELVAGSSVFM